MKDLYHDISLAQSVKPAAYTASVDGGGVDLAGYEGATVLVVPGTKTDGTHTPKLQESDDDNTYTDVAAGDLLGSFSVVASETPQVVGYIGIKKYIRVVVTVSGATTGAIYGAYILKGYPRHAPVR